MKLLRRRELFIAIAALFCVGATRVARKPTSIDIVRDKYGVPHIYVDAIGSEALVAAAYATAYAQAEDRLFEMDIFRRASRGRLSELALVGASYLPMDIEARRDGSTAEQLERAHAELPPLDRRILRAFSAGVNRRIAEVTADPSQLPIEFANEPPPLWQPIDTIAVGELELTRFAIGGGGELANARLLADLRRRFSESEARGIFDDVCWIDDPSAPVTIAPSEKTFPPEPIERFAPAQMELLDRYPAAFADAAAALDHEHATLVALAERLHVPLAAGHASNAIVIAGRLSASGYPILLGGPQTGLNLPSFFWEGGVHAGPIFTHGVGPPGVPGIAMGRTKDIAYTITSSADDDTDVYAEVIDPADSDHYLYRGQSVAFEHRVETFQVAGQKPMTQDFLRTVHGPVIYIDRDAGLAFSRRRALDGRFARTGSQLLKLALSTSLRQFLYRAGKLDGGFNLHYADTSGNIAYFHAGRRPRRPPHTDPRLPLLGTGEQEWNGVLRERPMVVNPASGYIANWNNKPALGWPVGDQREFWGPMHRVQGLTDHIDADIGAGKTFTVDRVNEIMRAAATSDLFVSRIVPFVDSAVDALSPGAPDGDRLRAAEALIDAWVADGAQLVAVGETLPRPGVAIYRELRTEAEQRIFGDELGSYVRTMLYPLLNEGNQEDDHGSWDTPDALLYRALQGSAATIPLSRDYFRNIDSGDAPSRDEALVDILRSALAALSARFGSDDMSRWLEPKLRTSYMNIGGADVLYGDTITERENRGSFNLLLDMAPAGENRIIVPPGQSGALTAADLTHEPPHLRDQLPLYQSFQYRRIPKDRADIEGPASTITLDLPADI